MTLLLSLHYSEGGVGDFEIINGKGEVILIGQKHLATISLLEHTSRSEVLTLDLSNVSGFPKFGDKAKNLRYCEIFAYQNDWKS